ncbi:hypothetical protein D9615_003366 [Tricholomella constricta]|uniref:Uncharacterized protein n=1 Tax=Tricholomella constricta TaxID=117010 RepID=A0A8H5HJB4_9AGAR|nr:hypothetical protein D9615_003366 [Tricholomella constricta]
MLASVVSRVRRHLRRQKSRHLLVPPDLRRWSDFMNPFPHVSPGGYRRYYETHGMPEPRPPPAPLTVRDPPPSRRRQNTPEPSSPSSPVPSLSTLPVPFPPDLNHQPTHSSPTSTTTSPSSSSRQRGAQKSTWTLSTILEASPTQSPTSVCGPALSKNSSLRRRRRQLLRTPSVERDFPGCAPALTFSLSTDSSATSSSTSTSTSTRCLYSVDTPSTTVEGLGLEEDRGSSLQKGDGYGDADDVDPYERSDSRSSYCTARNEFSDDEDD